MLYFIFLLCTFMFSCQSDKVDSKSESAHKGLLFKTLSAEESGIDFVNRIDETWDRNTLVFDYFYTFK